MMYCINRCASVRGKSGLKSEHAPDFTVQTRELLDISLIPSTNGSILGVILVLKF